MVDADVVHMVVMAVEDADAVHAVDVVDMVYGKPL